MDGDDGSAGRPIIPPGSAGLFAEELERGELTPAGVAGVGGLAGEAAVASLASPFFFALLGFLCVCATTTPAVLDVIERAEELTKVHAGERSFGAKAVYENDEGEMEPPRGFGNTNAGGGGGGGSRTPDRRRSPGGSPTRGSPGGFQWRDNAVAERDGVGRSRYGQGRRGY